MLFLKAKSYQLKASRGFTPSVEDGIAKQVSRPSQLKKPQVASFLGSFATRGYRKTMPSFTAGFTLIELLVVIAIIGILSTVVVSSVQSAREKAANAAVKAGLRSITAPAQMVYDSTNSYATVCANADITRAYSAAGVTGGGTGVCNNSSSAWAAAAPLKVAESGNTYWCVDSVGAVKGISSALGVAVVCP